MPRDWSELFITDEQAAEADGSGADRSGADRSGAGEPASERSGETPERRGGLFRRLRQNLAKTRQALGGEIQATLFQTLDEHTWERLEEALIMADVGAATTASVVATLEADAAEGRLHGGEALSERLIELLAADRAHRGRTHRHPRAARP